MARIHGRESERRRLGHAGTLVLAIALAVIGTVGLYGGVLARPSPTGFGDGRAGAMPIGPLASGPDYFDSELGVAPPSEVPIVPAYELAPETCANGTPANPFPVAYLPYGYETPNLYSLGDGSVGRDHLCYTGGSSAVVTNKVDFRSVGGAGGVLGFPHVEYGQDLWGGSPGTMAPGFVLPERESRAVHQGLWLTNTYAIHDRGAAAYDYVWDNFLSSYVPTPANVSGPGNYSLEIMLWMTTGYESSPWNYFPYEGSTDLPTLINASLSNQPWSFSYFCQGTNDNELTVLFFYNGTGGMVNATSRTFGVNFSAVLPQVNSVIHRADESCWSYPANDDSKMYLDDLNLGSEFLTPWPSPYYGTAVFHWTLSSMCFRFPRGPPTVASVGCS